MGTAAPKTEFKVISRPLDGRNLHPTEMTQVLNQMTSDGWEFASYSTESFMNMIIYLFKRVGP